MSRADLSMVPHLILMNEKKSTKFDGLSQCASIYYKINYNFGITADIDMLCFLHYFMLNITELELDVKQ